MLRTHAHALAREDSAVRSVASGGGGSDGGGGGGHSYALKAVEIEAVESLKECERAVELPVRRGQPVFLHFLPGSDVRVLRRGVSGLLHHQQEQEKEQEQWDRAWGWGRTETQVLCCTVVLELQ